METDDISARILIVDDDPAVHESYRVSFRPAPDADALADLAAELFAGMDGRDTDRTELTLTHVHQGRRRSRRWNARWRTMRGLPSPSSTCGCRRGSTGARPRGVSARPIPISRS
ncbi:hypothetical protein [Sphingomonas hankookensis]|uniref:hypothetical protein n=1 Tax=Sphingomonas hankookensis TaxID=563996 RepID=UPI003D3030EB